MKNLPPMLFAATRHLSRILLSLLVVSWVVPCQAKPTQADFFKSLHDNVSDSGDTSGHGLMGVLLGAVGVVLLLALFSSRRKREMQPKALNHSGKLLKEISKRVVLRPAEIKQLRLLAESSSASAKPIDNPLVMVLCPSVLAKSLKSPPVKIDRKVIAGLARKMGLTITKTKK